MLRMNEADEMGSSGIYLNVECTSNPMLTDARPSFRNGVAETITAHTPPCCATFTTRCCDARASIATPYRLGANPITT
jgi:hypothetical protein